jgi:hypothetical protein
VPGQLRCEGDVLGKAQVREKRKILKDDHHTGGGNAGVQVCPVFAGDAHRAFAGRFDTRDDLDEGRFARPGFPGKADGCARLYGKIDGVEGRDPCLSLGDRAQVDERGAMV